MPLSGFLYLLPEIFLSVSALILLMFGLFLKTRTINILSLIASVFACYLSISHTDSSQSVIWQSIFDSNYYIVFAKSLLCIISSLIFLIMVKSKFESRYEISIMILFLVIGSLSVLSSGSFIPMYIAIEIQSIASYAMLCSSDKSITTKETSIKYVMISAVSSCIMVFGISLLYMHIGSLSFIDLRDFIISSPQLPISFSIGMLFLLVGMSFKLSIFPMHMWVPDLYQTSRSFITLVIATIPKFAFVAFFAKFFIIHLSNNSVSISQILCFLSIISLFVSTLCAIRQDDLKRMMGYASISHISYITLNISSSSHLAIQSSISYIILYIIMTISFFCFLISSGEKTYIKISDLSNLRVSSPFSAFFLSTLIFSMAGIPPFGGFFTKLEMLQNILESKMFFSASMFLIANIISCFYYLKIVKSIYIDKPTNAKTTINNKCINFLFILASFVNIVYAFGIHQIIIKAVAKAASFA